MMFLHNIIFWFLQMIFGFQIKAARGLLKMSQIDLADKSGVSIPTIQRIENDEEAAAAANQNTMRSLERALEESGVKFIKAVDENGDGAGVRRWKENVKK